MTLAGTSPVAHGRAGRRWFVLGLTLAALSLLALAELFLRLSPPADLHPFLGEESPLCGPFRPDPDFGVAYRDWDAFLDDYQQRIEPYLPLSGGSETRPLWAMFGNSFVQAPGMLADHARRKLPSHRIFNLGKNELIEVRLAQIKLLLDQGMKPERIFFELMPVDLLKLGAHPLSTVHVTRRGAITYEPGSLPSPVRSVVTSCRLALAALVRAGQQKGNRRFNGKELYRRIDPRLERDLDRLFASLARVCGERGVPVTVLLIPAYHQVAEGDSFNFQDTLAPLLKRHGIDVFDPREAFLAVSDKSGLFIPDRHFSDVGNRLLLNELLTHLGKAPQGGAVVRARRRP
jgi:hypothetical protein